PENALAEALVGRLRLEAPRSPEAGDGIRYCGSHVDPEAVRFTPVLKVVPKLNAEILAGLLRVATAEEQNDRAQKVLLLASGLAGDGQSASRLIELLNDRSEKLWIRCEALRGLARSPPRAEAIRVLQIYSQDETPGPDPRHRPLRS